MLKIQKLNETTTEHVPGKAKSILITSLKADLVTVI